MLRVYFSTRNGQFDGEGLVVAALLVAAVRLASHAASKRRLTAGSAIPEKSIAVLPF